MYELKYWLKYSPDVIENSSEQYSGLANIVNINIK
ncbi:hypothetical protein DFR42_110160 [Undibacterium pigrum]|uniref:Uncharacterized protein n=1 Tax=Undibacterium pigrum TaxID=401470 RepID=A0A318IX57_9BURK|nr:hypothetical protein DFR42_110160 [Undibacterium pigrum]